MRSKHTMGARKLFIVALAFVMFITLGGSGGLSQSVSASEVESLGQSVDPLAPEVIEIMERQEKASKAYEILTASFTQTSEGLWIYPDNYGGSFIGDDDILHIQYVGDDYSEFSSLFDDSSAVIFDPVDFSYNTLHDVVDDNINLHGYVKGYVDVYTNEVVIELDAETVNETALNSQASEARLATGVPVRFELTSPVETTSELWAGDSIFMSGGGGYTLGVCGTYNGIPAIVTAGHGTYSGAVFNYNSTRIGAVAFHRYQNDAYGDYSIITLSNTSHTITNKCFGASGSTSAPIQIKGYIPSPPNGSVLNKYGAYGKWATIKVETTNMTSVSNGVAIRGISDCVVTAGEIKAGDSGGPIIKYEDSIWKICGFIYGMAIKNGKQYVGFTPYDLIRDKGFNVKTN